MSVSYKSIVFLLLTFAISWSFAITGWALGATGNSPAAIATLVGMMTGPAIAALVCAFAFEKGRRVEALGLAFKPNWWWLAAWLIGLALAAISVAATLLLSDRTLGDPIVNLRAMIEAVGQDASELDALPSHIGAIILVQAITLGALINAPVLTFTEELGWRGYLHGLWRPFGFWRTSLATGAIWGVWHAPAIYLFGHNYPTEPVLGVGLFVIWCILASPLMTLVRDRGGSVWAAGILHGTINAVGGLTVLWLSNVEFPWNGIAGIGGFVALALFVVAVAMLRPPPARVVAQ
jgi:membrane protease YdiL (CAAX protease family)